MDALLVSDLHLDDARPDITALFCDFLRREAARARVLYILGDLFEAWVGDDDDSAVAATVATELAALATAGVQCAFLHGNRDFLLGRDYAERACLRLLPDPCIVRLGGEAVLLSHGDVYCTEDLPYQQFRQQTRTSQWRDGFLSQPLEARKAFARKARAASSEHQRQIHGNGASAQREDITDVAPDAIASTLQLYGVRRMIHGHTHRPAVHSLQVADRDCERIVLGDWYEQGSVLRIAENGHADLDVLRP